MGLIDSISWQVKGWRLTQLLEKEKELVRAKFLIRRLRAENRALKAQRREMAQEAGRTIRGFSSIPHRYAAQLMAKRLGLNWRS
jgi:hypothetical protein